MLARGPDSRLMDRPLVTRGGACGGLWAAVCVFGALLAAPGVAVARASHRTGGHCGRSNHRSSRPPKPSRPTPPPCSYGVLSTTAEVTTERNSTLVFLLPVELLRLGIARAGGFHPPPSSHHPTRLRHIAPRAGAPRAGISHQGRKGTACSKANSTAGFTI